MHHFFKYSIFIFLSFTFAFVDSFSQTDPNDVVYTSQYKTGLITPARLSHDNEGNLYVTDNHQNSILKYDVGGNLSEFINLDFTPVSLAVDMDNQLFVGDSKTGNIYKRSNIGKITLFYKGCIFPSSMEISPDGLLYVADSKLQQVMALDVSGNLVKTIGKGTLIYPTAIAYDKTNNRILIAEHGGIGTGFTPVCKVWIFDLQGNILGSFGSYGSGDGQFYRIHGLTIGKCGNIYVSESYQGKISVFDKNGVFITKFGEFGNEEGQLNVPLDILFGSNERIFIASMNKGSVDIFTVSDDLPTSIIKNSDATICSGETTDIQIELTGISPWTFSYTIDGVNPTVVNTNDNVFTLTVSEPGIYEITELSDALLSGTCFTGSAVIDRTDILPSANISGGDKVICEGEISDIQIDFTGFSPWTFSYTQNGLYPKTIKTANNPHLISVNEAGLYEVTSVSGKGCIGSETTGSSEITVNQLPTSSFEAVNDRLTICEGSKAELLINFTGTSPWNFNYTVDENNTTPINNITEDQYLLESSLPGTYEIIMVSDANCSNYYNYGYPEVIILPMSIPDFSFDVSDLSVSFTNLSENADSYFWNFGDGTTSTDVSPSHSYYTSGTYVVELTASNTVCEDVIANKSVVIPGSSIEETMIKNFNIYPNPTTGIIELEFGEFDSSDINVEIYSFTGQKFYSAIFYKNSKQHIDLSKYNSGIYFIYVKSKNNSETVKLILNK